VTDSLPRAAPNSVPIRRTIQEFAGNEMHKESVNMYQDWEEAYRAAVLETDHNKLMDKIDSATTVLRKSLLEASSPPEHIGERQRIEDALRTLDMIRRTELQIPA